MSKRNEIIFLLMFTFLFFLPRIPRLNNDEINPDGVNWHYRTGQFIVGLKQHQFEKTYQHYHPGVTLMWISGIPIEIFKQVTHITVYDQYNFEAFNLVAKLSVVVAQFSISLIAIFLLTKLLGFYRSLVVASLFTFEPFFVGNSRLYHMDVLLALFLFCGLLFSYLALTKRHMIFMVLCGLFLSLSFLTKSIGVGALPFVLVGGVLTYGLEKKWKELFFYVSVVLASFAFFTFLFFPALWVRPVFYIQQIFSEAERIGIRKGHEQIVFGEYTTNAGPSFYPLVILVKSSPVLLFGILLYVLSLVRSFRDFNLRKILKNNLTLFLAVFYIGYIVFMTFPTKKLDRYMLVVYPFMGYLAASGYFWFLEMVKRLRGREIYFYVLMAFIIGVFWVYPFVKIFPYYFVYTNPLVGSPIQANKIIAQKPFGIGVFDLKKFILEKYGNYPPLGFIDTKPIKAIYPNSRVFDVRVEGTRKYDLLVLGVNEEMPQNVLESGVEFSKDSSIYINGLEYWRMYVKENQQ